MSDEELRDHFAIQALSPLMASVPAALDHLGDKDFWTGSRRDQFAKLAYQMADALLKARKINRDR